MKNKIKEILKDYKIPLISFIIVFLITLVFPYSGDDLGWSLENFNLSLFKNLYIDGPNGRYLGNFFVIIMTKNIFIRGLIMSITLVGIVEIIKKETNISRLIPWFLISVTPLAIFRQSIVWTSGFTNYVISCLFLLLSLRVVRKTYYEKINIITNIKNMLLIFMTSLFIENITVFLLLFLILLNIIYVIKNKKINKSLILLFIASLLGTITMFVHPAYHNIATGTDEYRQVASGLFGLIIKMCQNFVFYISKYIAFENIAVISILLFLLINYLNQNKKKYTKEELKVIKPLFTYMLFYTVYSIICIICSDWKVLLKYTDVLNAFLTGVYLLSLIVVLYIIFKKSKIFNNILWLVIIIIGLVSPLLIVSPIGPRNFFMIYVLEILLVSYILKETNIDYKKYSKLLIIIVSLMTVQYITVYSFINYANNKRTNYIIDKSNNTNEQLLILPKIPFESYVWTIDFDGEYHSKMFKIKNNIRKDIEFEFIDNPEWFGEIFKITRLLT